MSRSWLQRGSDEAFAESCVTEAVRRVKLEAKNDKTFVAPPDDTSIMLAVRMLAVPRQTPPPAPDDTNAILAARSYARQMILSLVGRALTFGAHLTGGSYDGSVPVTLGTDATPLNTASTIVSRDGSGNFAAGTMTGTATAATLAAAATKLATARAINGVNFDGTAPITVTADAATLTGTGLNTSVINSSLQSLGTLVALVLGVGVAPSLSSSGGAKVAGSAVLVAGTVTVATTAITATAFVSLTRKTAGGTVGDLTYTQINGTSITINSASATDTSTVNWFLLETH